MRRHTGTVPSRSELSKRLLVLGTATAFGFASLTSFAPVAHADPNNVAPGTTGGAFLGAEVVTIGLSLFGVRPGWVYIVGGLVGAGGGAAAGYAVEQGTTDSAPGTYMLAGGMVLAIPAIVLSLNATRYRPRDSASEDNAPTNGPPPDPGRAGSNAGGSSQPTNFPAPGPAPGQTTTPAASPASTPTTAPPKTSALPSTLLQMSSDGLKIGVPVPEVRSMFSAKQLKELGVAQGTEYRVPVVKVVF